MGKPLAYDMSTAIDSSVRAWPLSADTPAPESSVGGKAYNLIRMMKAGLAVPTGFVLPVEFFEPWFEKLRTSPQWRAFSCARGDALVAACDELRTLIPALEPNDAQTRVLDGIARQLQDSPVVSVRSSSPQEDLEGMSFAGAYESVLGVPASDPLAAILRVFASCFDARIEIYKRQHGLPANAPLMAVIIQVQIASEKSGVGFSINPLNNDHTEAVFNANWGLGETVVSGSATPDLFVVDKASNTTKAREMGAKEVSMWLAPDGGTLESVDPRHGEYCLDEPELRALTAELIRVEEFFDGPCDIEWAFAHGQLHLLQARPITTHLALDDSMRTPAGRARRLYFDVTISVQGVLEPLSALGLCVFERLGRQLKGEMLGTTKVPGPDARLAHFAHGRIYFDLINLSALAGSSRVHALLGQIDGLVQQAVAQLDMSTLARPRVPVWSTRLRLLARMRLRIPGFRRAMKNPKLARERWFRLWDEYRDHTESIWARHEAWTEFVDAMFVEVVCFIARETVVMFPNAKLAMAKIRKLFADPSPEQVEQLEQLDRALPGNVTVEMGHALYRLHSHLPADDLPSDVAEFRRQLESGALPAAFHSAWDRFIKDFGFRGTVEIDVGAPRYREAPEPLLEQILDVARNPGGRPSPIEDHENSGRRRRAAFEALARALPSKQRARFSRLFEIVETLGGFRETHKFVMMYCFDRIRARIVSEAEKLVAAGRLDAPTDVFDLDFDTLQLALDDPSIDLGPAVARGRAQRQRDGQCKAVWPLMDSCGRFIRPEAPPAKPGEWVGQGVSSGLARGRVKVLGHLGEKSIEPGDILVTRATNPAWTPLFVPAEAIVLEVGGPLQHGALVAREYGKPCVSGIRDAMTSFEDGEWVEVDGTNGIVRRCTGEDTPA